MKNQTDSDLYTPLAEPVRRQIYEIVRQSVGAVSRDEVATRAGISRKLAAFHLDKLLETGWLTATYSREANRSGPGAGRPAKRYMPSEQSLELSIPDRNYALPGRLLAQAMALENESSPPASEIARELAQAAGAKVGDRYRREFRLRRPGVAKALAATAEVLETEGFEPCSLSSGEIALRNCPFHDLAKEAPETICGMNQRFIIGIVRGLGNHDLQVILDPQPGYCCVRVTKPNEETAKG